MRIPPKLYRDISQDFVDSIATNLYGVYIGTCTCKPSHVCNIQYCVPKGIFGASEYKI